MVTYRGYVEHFLIGVEGAQYTVFLGILRLPCKKEYEHTSARPRRPPLTEHSPYTEEG